MRSVGLFARVSSRWSRILSGRKGLLFLLVACLFLVLFFGLKSIAKDSEDSFFRQDSGALDYLEISAPGAENLEYVILNQVAAPCGAPAFSSGADIRSALQRIEASVIEDTQALALCIRADYGSSRYVYRKYMEDKGFLLYPISANSVTSPMTDEEVGDDSLLQVVFLHHEIQQIHYVVLEEWGMQCNPGVFEGSAGYEVKALRVALYESGGKPRMRTATVELVGQRQSLCFRASYSNGNFTYDQYGGAKIEWRIDPREDNTDDGAATTEYHVFSTVRAVNMQAVELQSLGDPCSVEAFQPDGQVYATSYDELLILRKLSPAQEAICLRVDYGDGYFIYKKYPEDLVVVTPHYKLSLTLKREDSVLTVSSNTDVVRWRLFRDYPYTGIARPNDDSLSRAHLGNHLVSRCAYAGQSDEPEVRDIVGRFERQPVNKSSDPQKGFVFDLMPEDYGEAYCVEAIDGDGNRGYLVTNVIQSNLNIAITQDGDVLSAVVNKPELVNSWQAIRITDIKECSDYSFIHRPIHADQSSLALTAADDNRFYCFRVNDIYGGHKVAASGRISMENPGVADLKQLGGQLFVQARSDRLSTGYVRSVQGRFVRVSADSACNSVILDNAETVQSLSWYYIFELIPLTAPDVGYSYCVEITFANGLTSHKLSVPISPFQVSSSDAAEDFQNLVNLILLSPYGSNWDDGLTEDVDFYSRQPDAVAQISAYTEQYGVEISTLRDVLIDALAGSGYFGVDDLNDFIEFGWSRNDANDLILVYDFEVPDDLSPQAFADSLRPHLTVMGRQILDNTGVVFDPSIREYAAGIYNYHRSISLAIDDDEIDYYSQADELTKRQIFGRLMGTFIHEFVHATDYQDDAINASEFEELDPDGDFFQDQGLSDLAWSCLERQPAPPPSIFSLASNISEGDGLFIEDLYWNSSDAGLKDYYACLDQKQPLMAALRLLHDSPPADYWVGGASGEGYLIHQGYLMNIAVRWGRDSYPKKRSEVVYGTLCRSRLH